MMTIKTTQLFVIFSLFSLPTLAEERKNDVLHQPVNLMEKVCEYTGLSKAEKNNVLKSALSTLPHNIQQQLTTGLSNFVVFLDHTQDHYQRSCKDQNKNRKLCENLPRRAKTFYHIDLVNGVNKVEAQISKYRPQLENLLSGCSQKKTVISAIINDFKDQLDVSSELKNSQFSEAQKKLISLAQGLSIPLKDSRVPVIIKKPQIDNNKLVYDVSSVDSPPCDEDMRGLKAIENIFAFGSFMKRKVIGFFNPAQPKGISTK